MRAHDSESRVGSGPVGWVWSSCPKCPPLVKKDPYLSLNLNLYKRQIPFHLILHSPGNLFFFFLMEFFFLMFIYVFI